jgi:uncharacterized protein DUF1837
MISAQAENLPKKPKAFLKPLINEGPCGDLALTVLHAGYEGGAWRCQPLATHMLDWLPEFALSHKEAVELGAHDAGELMRKAARRVFTTKKYGKRGEFGELLLHIAVRQMKDSTTAISKIYFKDTANDVVKGFDSVHVVGTPDNFELWLGEAKFYEDCKKAISAACESLEEHMDFDFLKSEFTFIADKVDDANPFASVLKDILHENTSLDSIVKRIVLPVLVTYDSGVLASNIADSPNVLRSIVQECEDYAKNWSTDKKLIKDCEIVLYLVPLNTKKALNEALNDKLIMRQEL